MDWRKTHLMWRKSRPGVDPGKLQLLRAPQPEPMDFAKTQVLPIEQVAQVLRTHHVDAKPLQFDGARTQRIPLQVLRKKGHPRQRAVAALLCLSALLVASAHAALSTGGAPARRRSPPPPMAARPAAEPEPEREGPRPADPPRPNPPPSTPPTAAQRKLVDALASGDTARAAELYADLAARDPGERMWAVAAQVLSARARKN